MLRTYNYSGITKDNWNKVQVNTNIPYYHTVRNTNAKLSVIVPNTAISFIMVSFDKNAEVWTTFVRNDVPTTETPTNTECTSLYFIPGVTYVGVYPESGTVTMQVVEYYEPGTQ